MSKHIRKRKCKHCHSYFQPDYRNCNRQKFCSKADCRKASKADSQRRWLQKPQNRDYFKGSVHVERVRRWRQNHPGYWRKPQQSQAALREACSVETVDSKEITENLVQDALQDVLSAQVPVMLGLIAQLTGSSLQDDIAAFARRLRQLGNDILNPQYQQKGGRRHDLKTHPVPGAGKNSPGRVQLAGPSAGP